MLKNQAGLALVETLFIVLVGALLTGYLGLKFFSGVKVPKSRAAVEQMHSISEALDRFYQDNQRYPSADEGLNILTGHVRGSKSGNNQKPYLDNLALNDPWGNPYVYNSPAKDKEYVLLSLGADGKTNGTGEDADIIY